MTKNKTEEVTEQDTGLTPDELKWQEKGTKIGTFLHGFIIIMCRIISTIAFVLFLFLTKRKPPIGNTTFGVGKSDLE